MTRHLTDDQLDTLADVALDIDARLAAEDATARETAEPQPA